MRRELPAETKREAERRQRLMQKAVQTLTRVSLQLESLDGMTGNTAADFELEKAQNSILRTLNILR